jgi:hypothetical protein
MMRIRIRDFDNPGSGMEKSDPGSWIKIPESATLVPTASDLTKAVPRIQISHRLSLFMNPDTRNVL